MKKLLLFFLTASVIVFFNQACSSDEGGGTTPPAVTSITISANNASVLVGETISFTVRTNTGSNVTANSTISVNNNSISGSSYSSNTAGSYTVKASYNNLSSNTLTVNFTAGGFNSISLSLSSAEVEINNPVTFTAMGDNGADLTSQATFTVDGVAISGNSYTPTEAGTYYVRARIGTISSDQESFVAFNPPATSIALVASDETPNWGDNVTFTVEDNFGVDVTDESTIYVDGAVWTGGALTSEGDATFECYATFESLNSETVTVTFSERPDYYKKNVLIEDFTGTWCGYCPRVSHAIELVEAETTHVFPVAIHGGGSDPYIRINSNPLQTLIEMTGYPTAMVDRMTPWTYPESSNLDQITSIAGTETNLGLAISSSLSGETVTADIKVSYAEDFSQELELVAYLLEDGLTYNQANYYDNLYGGQNPIVNFVHNDVASGLFTEILGDDIPEAVAGQEHSVSLDVDLISSIENTDNLYIVALVIDAATNDCLNAQRVKVGETQGYEYY